MIQMMFGNRKRSLEHAPLTRLSPRRALRNPKTMYSRAASLLGTTVEMNSDEGDAIVGFVEKVELGPGGALLQINGQKFHLEQLNRILTNHHLIEEIEL